RSPTRWAPISWSTWRISPGWWPAACFRARCRTRISSRRPRTRPCAARVAAKLGERGVDIVSGGTDCHLMLVDLRRKGLTGKVVEKHLEQAGMTCNKNGVPFDPEKPTVTSGVRLGSPAGTTRGFGTAEFTRIGELIGDVLDGLAANGEDGNEKVEARIREEVRALCRRFPIYG